MPDLWYTSDHVGSNTTQAANGWISTTINRPAARQALNGLHPFIAKAVAFKCCAAPSLGQKMYGRVSTADGAVYDNSYIGNTISWQKESKVVYLFQAINLHFSDDGGQKIRCWLVSGGPFLFATGGGGTTQSANGEIGGSPIGYLRYAEVALPPTGLSVTRDTANMNKVTVTWNMWDVKKNFDECGGTYALSGYCVQAAKDPDFTKEVRIAYLAGRTKGSPETGTGTGDIYGLYQGWDWYFRIATRNEVSDKYKLTGGIWSAPFKLPLTTYTPPTPAANAGIGGSPSDGGASGTDTAGSTSSAAANNPSSTSGLSSGSTTKTTNTITKGATDQSKSIGAQAGLAASQAHANPSVATWTVVANLLTSMATLAATVLTQAPTNAAQWTALQSQITAARALVAAASSAASGTQSDGQQLDAASSAVAAYFATLQVYAGRAQTSGGLSDWQRTQAAANDIASAAAPLVNSTTLPAATKALWVTVVANATALANAVAAYIVNSVATNRQAALLAVVALVNALLTAQAAGGVASTIYAQADTAVQALVTALKIAVANTPLVLSPGVDGSAGSGGTSGSGGTDGAADTGVSTSGSTITTIGGSTVYAPIPDTSAMRVANGGTLISRDPPGAVRHTAFIMDRGGRDRIGQLRNITSVTYNRVRDDQSVAEVVLDAQSVMQNKAVLDVLSVGRHELLIYRGTTRVWEGPLTHSQITKDRWVLNATDITHYLNRTVVKNAYSNAGVANMDFTVNRIAGILANELAIKESLDPPVNILPFVQTHVQAGDARTTRSSLAAEFTIWQHLDDLAAKAGIDYTVVGRALIIWDTSRAAIGTTRVITTDDFDGDPYIAAYGMDLATATYVSDGQGDFGMAGGIDDYYGEVELLSGAYDENGNAVDGTDGSTVEAVISVSQLSEQAARNLVGRNPTPIGLHVPDGSGFRLDRGIGLDVLIPGVYMPVQAALAGVTIGQIMKLKEVKVSQTNTGETVLLTLTPAASSDTDEYLLNSNDPVALSS